MSKPGISGEVQCRDIIVIGGSAGSLQPLQRILSDLPGNLEAAVFIVLHVGATSHLTEILGRVSVLPIVQADSGRPIELGRVYVSVPDCGVVRVRTWRARPSIRCSGLPFAASALG